MRRPQKLPVIRMAALGWLSMAAYPKALALTAAPLFALSFGMAYFGWNALWDLLVRLGLGQLAGLVLFLLIVTAFTLATSTGMVGWVRAVLRGGEVGDSRHFLALGRRELKFAGYVWLLLILFLALLFLCAPVFFNIIAAVAKTASGAASESSDTVRRAMFLVIIAITLGLFAPVLWVVARLAIQLTGVAHEDDSRFDWTLSASRGNGWRLFAVLMLSMAPIIIVFARIILSDRLFSGPRGSFAGMSPYLVIAAILLSIMAAAASLALCYARLSDSAPPAPLETGPDRHLFFSKN